MALLVSPPWLAVLAALGGFGLLGTYLYNRLYYLRFKEFAAWPQLKPSLILGHTATLGEKSAQRPNEHNDYAIAGVRESLGNPPTVLFDIRPFMDPLLVICTADLAEQISKPTKTHQWSVPKSRTQVEIVDVVGPHSILHQEGENWKGLRRRFNPGFAPQHLLRLLPTILDKTQLFLDHLDRFAQSGEEFEMGQYVVNLTFDIIGAVVMDVDLHAQKAEDQQNEIITQFRNLQNTYLHEDYLIFKPLDRIRRKLASRRLQTLLRAHVVNEFNADQRSALQQANGSRSVLSLSLQGLDKPDPVIVDATCDQLRTFLFAGHDTTSIALQWAIYELSRTPRALATLRREMDDLFGPDPDPQVVRDRLLAAGGGEIVSSKMPYTSAVIKETLRLYPPGASARRVAPGTGMTLRLPDGSQTPCIDGMTLYMCHYLIQRDPAVYGETANDFVPERWLGNTDTWMTSNDDDEHAEHAGEKSTTSSGSSSISPSAWRPFERGPRNCIGQELANIEMRVILACIARRYDFSKVGLGQPARDVHTRQPILNAKGQYESVSELYNIRQITCKPADGCMMTAKLSERALSAASFTYSA